LESDYPLSYVFSLSGIIVNTPDINILLNFIAILILLIASALTSATEVAFFSFRPEDIELFKAGKDNKSKAILRLYDNPERLLSTILVANNTVNIAIVLLSGFLSSRMFDFTNEPVLGFIINVIVITFLILFFGEVMPKVFASRNHLTVAYLMAYPMVALEKVFRPVTRVLMFSSSFVRKRTQPRRSNISMDDLSDALELTSDEINDDEKILKGIVNFGNINVSAIMCPRIDVTAIDIKSDFGKVVNLIIDSGFSRIPVYQNSFDTVKGILYAKDVLPYTDHPGNFKWQSLVRPPYFVPETKKINDLLKEFQTKKNHMAIVIDEYGGSSGIITLEDILEEIVGEITDEGDEDSLLHRKIDDNTYVFEAKILLNDFCKILNINEEIFDNVRGEAETLAGLILELTGEIPQKDQRIDYNQFSFKIESADKRRIKEVKVEINSNDEK